MYFTCLPTKYTSDFSKHEVHFASSTDGKTWWHHGKILSSSVGVWSPSAVNIGGKLFVYFHTGILPSLVYRQQLSWNGWEKVGGSVLVSLPKIGGSHNALNVDLAVNGSKVTMVANDLSVRNVVRYESTDSGKSFKRASHDSSFLIYAAPTYWALTPHQEWVSQSEYRIYFGWDTTNEFVPGVGYAPLHSESIHQWGFRNK